VPRPPVPPARDALPPARVGAQHLAQAGGDRGRLPGAVRPGRGVPYRAARNHRRRPHRHRGPARRVPAPLTAHTTSNGWSADGRVGRVFETHHAAARTPVGLEDSTHPTRRPLTVGQSEPSRPDSPTSRLHGGGSRPIILFRVRIFARRAPLPALSRDGPISP